MPVGKTRPQILKYTGVHAVQCRSAHKFLPPPTAIAVSTQIRWMVMMFNVSLLHKTPYFMRKLYAPKGGRLSRLKVASQGNTHCLASFIYSLTNEARNQSTQTPEDINTI